MILELKEKIVKLESLSNDFSDKIMFILIEKQFRIKKPENASLNNDKRRKTLY